MQLTFHIAIANMVQLENSLSSITEAYMLFALSTKNPAFGKTIILILQHLSWQLVDGILYVTSLTQFNMTCLKAL